MRSELYIRHKSGHVNGRFRRSKKWMFSAYSDYVCNQIDQGMYVNTKGIKGGTNLTRHDMLTRASEDEVYVSSVASNSLAQVKGTRQYRASQRAALEAICEELGPATYFHTWSFPDMSAKYVYLALLSANSDLEGIEHMTQAQLVAMDPATCEETFHRQVSAYLKHIINVRKIYKADQNYKEHDVEESDEGSDDGDDDGEDGLREGPLGDITAGWYRVEAQARGTLHVHSVLWSKDAPIMNGNNVEEILNFLEDKITVRIPHKTEEPYLYEFVKKHQMHKCTISCKKGRKRVC